MKSLSLIMDEKTKDKIMNIIIYGGFVYLLIFFILKGLGVINTPLIIFWSPAIVATILVGTTVHKIFKEFYVLHGLPDRVERIEKEQIIMRKNMTVIQKDVDILRRDVDLFTSKV